MRRTLTAYLAGAATGRRYQIDIEKLTPEEQHELLRLVRDLMGERDAAKRQPRIYPFPRF